MDVKILLGGASPRLLGRAARERLAADLRSEAESPAFADPRFIALRLGRRLVLRAGPGERTTANALVYEWDSNDREQGGRIHYALAESYLLGRGIAYTPQDVCLVALEVALPRAERAGGVARLIWHQRHLPIAAIREGLAASHPGV